MPRKLTDAEEALRKYAQAQILRALLDIPEDWCHYCGQWVPCRQEERDETRVNVCCVCGRTCEPPF
jgi:hypothetical protein